MSDFPDRVRGALGGICRLEAAMNIPAPREYSGQLIAEIQRYLEAVELFRALSCEPQ